MYIQRSNDIFLPSDGRDQKCALNRFRKVDRRMRVTVHVSALEISRHRASEREHTLAALCTPLAVKISLGARKKLITEQKMTVFYVQTRPE